MKDIATVLTIFFVLFFVGLPLPAMLSTTKAYYIDDPQAVMAAMSEPPLHSGHNYSGRFYKPLRSVAESQRILQENLVYMWTRWGAAVLLASAALWFESRGGTKCAKP